MDWDTLSVRKYHFLGTSSRQLSAESNVRSISISASCLDLYDVDDLREALKTRVRLCSQLDGCGQRSDSTLKTLPTHFIASSLLPDILIKRLNTVSEGTIFLVKSLTVANMNSDRSHLSSPPL